MGPVPGGWTEAGATQSSPTLSRLMVGMTLRRLREARGITREAACQAIRASESKISRLELGRTGVKLRDVADLCTLYGVTDHIERATLLGLARLANSPEWWHPYRDLVPGWLEPYLGLEQAATVIRGYQVQFVPGLLQTSAYARAVIELAHGASSQREIDRRVELRMGRQHVLQRPQPVHLWALIDEAALRRPIGGRATMTAQLRHLLDACDIDRVTVQVLTFRSGGHAAAGGAVTMLRLPDPELPDVVYLETLTTAVYPDRRADIDYYRHMMNLLTFQAEPADATPAILRQILGDL
jgi:transcriptional regulator with XRE-family HTH domain